MELVLKEFDTVCETEGFIRGLDVDLVCEVIERDELRVESGEEVVFEAVLRWLGGGWRGGAGYGHGWRGRYCRWQHSTPLALPELRSKGTRRVFCAAK